MPGGAGAPGTAAAADGAPAADNNVGGRPARRKKKGVKWLNLAVAGVGILGIVASLFWDDVVMLSSKVPWLNEECPHLKELNELQASGSKGGKGGKGGGGGVGAGERKPFVVRREPEVSDDGFVTAKELSKHDGTDLSRPILLAIAGDVFDVTEGERFYGRDAPYNVFAGQHFTRALSLGSLDSGDMSSDIDDFTASQRRDLDERIKFYHDKYKFVGKLKMGGEVEGGARGKGDDEDEDEDVAVETGAAASP